MADWTTGELQLALPLRLTADDATTEFPDLDAALAKAVRDTIEWLANA